MVGFAVHIHDSHLTTLYTNMPYTMHQYALHYTPLCITLYTNMPYTICHYALHCTHPWFICSGSSPPDIRIWLYRVFYNQYVFCFIYHIILYITFSWISNSFEFMSSNLHLMLSSLTTLTTSPSSQFIRNPLGTITRVPHTSKLLGFVDDYSDDDNAKFCLTVSTKSHEIYEYGDIMLFSENPLLWMSSV